MPKLIICFSQSLTIVVGCTSLPAAAGCKGGEKDSEEGHSKLCLLVQFYQAAFKFRVSFSLFAYQQIVFIVLLAQVYPCVGSSLLYTDIVQISFSVSQYLVGLQSSALEEMSAELDHFG